MALSPGKLICVFGLLLRLGAGQVIELDDSFPEKKGDFPWLVEFYAPWCGHCKKLEPIYHRVAMSLKGSPIRVAKVDATRFTSLASDYGIRGYPTIKFIQGEHVFTHRGDRSQEGIVEFAKRAQGPQVRPLSNMGKFNDIRSDHSDDVFFIYIGAQDSHGDLMKKFSSLAEKFAVLGYFYSGEKRVLPENVQITHDPTVLVFKDGTYYEYEPSESGALMSHLDDWINSERYTAFPKIAGGALNEMTDMKKKIVMVVTNEKDKKNYEAQHERVKAIGRTLATQYRERFHPHFQFMWMGESDTASSITLSTKMDVPNIVVLDPQTQYFWMPESPMSDMTPDVLAEFLDDVQGEKIVPWGGTSYFAKTKRVFFDIWIAIYEIYETSGWLALMIFGVPVCVVSIICYALCCMEPVDESIFEPPDEEELKALQEAEEKEKAAKEKEKDALPPPEEPDDDGHMKKE